MVDISVRWWEVGGCSIGRYVRRVYCCLSPRAIRFSTPSAPARIYPPPPGNPPYSTINHVCSQLGARKKTHTKIHCNRENQKNKLEEIFPIREGGGGR